MAIKFEKIVPDMVLYERKRQKMGNTTLTRVAEYAVRIISVNPTVRYAMVSWNGNAPEKFYERRLTKLYTKKMEKKPTAFGL
jgi:hypothetical protein